MEDALGSAGPDGVSATTGLLALFGLWLFIRLLGFLVSQVSPLRDAFVQRFIGVPASWPKGVKFEMETLPVHAKSVPDGDGINVYVLTAYSRESWCVPIEVHIAAVRRSWARAQRNYAVADELQQEIVDAGYRMIYLGKEGGEVLAQRYRIRLRGIDAPENEMDYGKEAKEALVEIVESKCLKVLVYEEDQFGRYVADVYCNGRLVQELMLRGGFAWHFTAFDQRQEFARWEKQARAMRIGLWASPNPEKPWTWRKKQRQRQRQSESQI